jgi:hypothetical protein
MLSFEQERQSQSIIYFIVHKQNEFLKYNLKPAMRECSKVTLFVKRDMM